MLRSRQTTPSFDQAFQSPQRNPFFPQIALRRRSNDHPMVMFALIAATAIGCMAMAPTAGTAFANSGEQIQSRDLAPSDDLARTDDEVRTTEKTSRPVPTDVDVACRGQAWGAETPECLGVIAKEAGKTRDETKKIRMIADAGAPATTPNIF